MTDLTAGHFTDFFIALWKKPPFAWQRALAERALTHDEAPWPEAIALPTAAGKTACIDIAVFALAAQVQRLARGEAITAPRRIFFVVDRRIIVDEAFARAGYLANELHKATDGILKSVADALRLIARGEPEGSADETPLTVHTLRGASYRSESWARSPLQPAIIASTVDQLGSRLLFRAYGRGPGMWPVYAGLTANDSLVLLDEAHCARPFLQTLRGVDRYRSWAKTPLERSFHPVVLSATPPPGLDDIFSDTSDEPGDPDHPLGRRQLAHKPTVLLKVDKASGKKATDYLAKALAETAESLSEGENRAVVVFVNRVATARAARDILTKRHAGQITLLTGRMRGVDKETTIDGPLKQLSSAEAETRELDRPHFVVATQTLEVGADLDFDVLVTECAALDALRQRFGRLNRMGRPIETRAAILIRGDQADKSDDDPVYGPALARTWTWLNEHLDDQGEIDFGIAHLAPRLPAGDGLDALNSPSLDAPVMLPAHVDCWAQTNPEPLPSPEVALFLHGPRETRADVQVCWRIDLNTDALALCPPSATETLPVPIGLFRRWLAGEPAKDDSSDIEGETEAETTAAPEPASPDQRSVLRWQGNEFKGVSAPTDVHPGDVIVIPLNDTDSIRLGELPDTPGDELARLDVGERAHLSGRAKALLRLHPSLIARWPPGEARAHATALLDLDDEDPDEQLRLLRDMLDSLEQETRDQGPRKWLHDIATQLQREASRRSFLRNLRRVGERDFVITGQGLIAEYTRQAETFSDEDDASASGTTNRRGGPVLLRDHLPGVETWARRFAAGCGLPNELTEAVARAGLLHDLGKADPRFQSLMRGGSPVAFGGEPLAKSGALPKTRAAYEAARAAAGYPVRGRHELLSVRLAEGAPELLPADPMLRELTLHLVGSHHGHCRPFAPVVIDDHTLKVSYALNDHRLSWSGPTGLEHLEAGVTRRFWRLVETYGWWGLAWLESLLRLADHRRSEWEETNDTETGND